MKAIIISDEFDHIETLLSLENELLYKGIGLLKFSSLDEFKGSLSSLENGGKYLFFSSPYIRYPSLDQLIDTHEINNFSNITYNAFTAAFTKAPNTQVSKDSIYTPETPEIFSYRFNADPIFVTPEHPYNARIFINTHQRDKYLFLTVNSLIHAMTNARKIPITIILNDATPATREVACSYLTHDFVDVLEVNKNLAIAGLNVGIQWYRPEVVVMAEDDFILPSCVSESMPCWTTQMLLRLQRGIDVVGWQVTLDNVPYNHLHDFKHCHNETRIGWHRFLPGESFMMSQHTAVKVDLWKRAYDPVAKTTFDRNIVSQSKSIATPFIKGYNLGFDPRVDGYWNAQAYDDMYKLAEDKLNVIVRDVRTSEERTINLDQV